MDLLYEQDGLSSVDMVELGVRPIGWDDINKEFDDSLNDFFGKEKTADFTVYSAELQLNNNGKKITTNEEDLSMSDDDNNNDYEIDPETGEKIFREVTFASTTPLSLSNDKWIEEYLSNIESSSNQALPVTTTSNNSEIILDDIPFSLDEQTDSDWLSNIINFDETSDSMMFTDPIQLLDNNENKFTTAPRTFSIDDEYSTSSSSQQHLYFSLENDTERGLVEAKLEKIEHDENPMSQIMIRRQSARSSNQGQQDEDALHQFNIPLTFEDITQSSTEEYNRHLARLSHLNSDQIHIIKDIRRRGKNKIAAQNCRKRKAVSVESLLEEVDELKRVKHELEERKKAYQQQIAETRNQYEYLHRQVLPDRQLPPAIIVK